MELNHKQVLDELNKTAQPPKKTSRALVIIVVTSVLFAVSLASVFLMNSRQSKPKSVGTGQNYYFPSATSASPYIYKYSGVLNTDKSAHRLVTNYAFGDEQITVSQPANLTNFTCKPRTNVSFRDRARYQKSFDAQCNKPFQTAEGWTVYSTKAGGSAALESDDRAVTFTSVFLNRPDSKAAFLAFVDSLEPMAKSAVAAYDRSQRQKSAWGSYYTLPFPVYLPAEPPSGLPARYRDVNLTDPRFGSQPTFSTIYSNKKLLFDPDNTSSTYRFSFTELARPADYKPYNCIPADTKSTCTELPAVDSPAGRVSIDQTKYFLYQTSSALRADLVADFGKTLIYIEYNGPLDQVDSALKAQVIRALNTMTTAKLADLEFVGRDMNEPLSEL